MTPLMQACDNNLLPVVTNLINHGADMNKKNPCYGKTALTNAIDRNYEDIANKLIDNGADLKIVCHGRISFLMLACVSSPNLGLKLIDLGCSVKQEDKHKRTPLMWAATYGRTQIIQKLLEMGADANRKNSTGETALLLSCKNKHDEDAALLLFDKTDFTVMTNEEKQQIIDHCFKKKFNNVNLSLKIAQCQEFLNYKNKNDVNLLMLACLTKMEAVGLVLVDKVSLTHRDKGGWSALVYACHYRMQDVAIKIIDKLSENNNLNTLDIATVKNRTYMYYAYKNNLKKVIARVGLLYNEILLKLIDNRRTLIGKSFMNKYAELHLVDLIHDYLL